MAVVLCTGYDKALMETRRLLLEASDHKVVPVSTEVELQRACAQRRFDVVILGQSLPPNEKLAFLAILKRLCPTTKILELYTASVPRTLEAADDWLQMRPDRPTELVDRVAALAKK